MIEWDHEKCCWATEKCYGGSWYRQDWWYQGSNGLTQVWEWLYEWNA